MLIFIDESGDPGLKLKEGSSAYFVIALVVFEDNEEAIACDQRIQLLRRELGRANAEFHFKRNPDRVREAFIKAVVSYEFFYYAIVLNKNGLYRDGFKDNKSFYKYACNLLFENAKEKLSNALVVIDRSGSLDFQRQLEKYLKLKMNNGLKRIKSVKMQKSISNNLLQLADYVAGIINRSVQHRKDNFGQNKNIS